MDSEKDREGAQGGTIKRRTKNEDEYTRDVISAFSKGENPKFSNLPKIFPTTFLVIYPKFKISEMFPIYDVISPIISCANIC